MSQEHVVHVRIQESGLFHANKALAETQRLLDRVVAATAGAESAFGRAAGQMASAANMVVGGMRDISGAVTSATSAKKVFAAVKKIIKARVAGSTKNISLNATATSLNTTATSLNTTAQNLNAKATARLTSAKIALAAGSKKAAVGLALKAAALKVVSVASTIAAGAMKLLNIVMKANPIGLVIAAVVALIAAFVGLVALGSRVLNFFQNNREATTADGRNISDLAEQYNRSTEDIEADMERMGTTCLDVWEAQEQGIQSLSDTWGICAEQIREEIADMAEELGCHETAMATWESQQMQMLQGVSSEWGMCADQVLAQISAMGLSADEWSAQMGQAWDSFQADVSRNVDGIVNGFRRIPTEYEKSSEDLRAIMEANIATTEDWRNNMAQIAGDVPEDMLAWLESKGPEFNHVVEDMLHTPGALEAWKDTFDRATALGTAQAVDNLDCPMITETVVSRLNETGQAVANSTDIPDGFEQNIQKATKVATAAAAEGGRETGEAYAAAVEAGLERVDFKPVVSEMDRATTQMATTADSAMNRIETIFRNGMETAKNIMNRALQTMVNKVQLRMAAIEGNIAHGVTRIVNTFNTLQDKLWSSGFNAMAGFNRGLLAMEGTVMATARRIADNVATAIRRALQINSPSRVMMKLGGDTMGGFARGMEQMQTRVQRVVRNTAYAIQDGLGNLPDGCKLDSTLTLNMAPSDSAAQSRLLERLIDAVEAGKHIVMDSGELVGATYPHFDSAAGSAITYNKRWGR